jgi:hypothetical protein
MRAEQAAAPVAVAPPVREAREPVEQAPATVVAHQVGEAAAQERADAAGARREWVDAAVARGQRAEVAVARQELVARRALASAVKSQPMRC